MKFKTLKQMFCTHEYKWMEHERFVGYTATWSLKKTKEFESEQKCSKCGKIETKRYIYCGEIMD